MAGDWIKMRLDLADDPAVVSMACALDISEDEVVGKLHRLWGWADRHTTDGTAPGISAKWVNRYISAGFAEAMVAVGWIAFTDSGVEFPDFEKHNGASAKKRGEDAIRQRLSRENRDKGVTGLTRVGVPAPFVRHVFERDNYCCVFCGTQSSEAVEKSRKAILSVDHLVPSTRGGESKVPNLATSCRPCNTEKNDRTPEEWGLLPAFLQPGVTYSQEAGMSQGKRDKGVTRGEKKREEKKNTSPSLRSGEVARPEEIAPELWDDYRAVRTAKKGGVVTATALAGLQREAAKAGVSLETAIRTCCELSWVGFNAGWYAERQAGPRASTAPRAPAGNRYAGAAAAIFGPSPPQQQDFIDV